MGISVGTSSAFDSSAHSCTPGTSRKFTATSISLPDGLNFQERKKIPYTRAALGRRRASFLGLFPLLSLLLGGLVWVQNSNGNFFGRFWNSVEDEDSSGFWIALKGLEELAQRGNALVQSGSSRRQLTDEDTIHALRAEQLEVGISSETLTRLDLSSIGFSRFQTNKNSKCQANACPEFTSCDVGVKVCTIPEIVDNHIEIKTNVSSKVLQCPEIITSAGGKRKILVNSGDVLQPGCLDPEGETDRGSEQLEEWGVKVFVLKNVFLDSKGNIFNATHIFDHGSCQWASNVKFSYPAGTKVTVYSSVINLLASDGDRAVSREVIEKLPMLFLLSPLLFSSKRTAVAVHDTKFLRTVAAPALGIELGLNALHISSSSSHLHFSHLLIQPLFQRCKRPSPALWSRLRQRHLLPPEGLPMLNPDWTPRPFPPMTMETNGAGRVSVEGVIETGKWVVVMAIDPSSMVERSEVMREMLANAFGMERVVVFSGNANLKEVKALFNRAILFIAPAGSFLYNTIFMPDNATVLELRPISSPPRSSSVSNSLALACNIRQFILFCQAGASNSKISCNLTKVEDILDEIHVDVFTSEAATIAAAAALGVRMGRSAHNKSSSVWAGKLPGSILRTEDRVREFQAWMACVGQKGSWQIDETPRILPWSFNGYARECDVRQLKQPGGIAEEAANDVVRSGGGSEKWNVRESLKFEWLVPNGKCPWDDNRGVITSTAKRTGSWAPFDARYFCDTIVGRHNGGRLTLLFLGDSKTEQFTFTFLNNVLMLQKAPKEWAAPEVRPKVCEGWVSDPNVRHGYCREYVIDPAVCKGLRVVFIRNDHLALHNARGVFDRIPWTRLPILREADVVITNRGAHYEPDDAYVEAVQAALRFIRNRFPGKLVIYRNTPPGHANCTNYKTPIFKRQDPTILPYNWDKFAGQNVLAKRIVEDAGGIYMDVDTMTALRADGHKGFTWYLDCLHYCLPGPVDLWVRYLYNILDKTLPLNGV